MENLKEKAQEALEIYHTEFISPQKVKDSGGRTHYFQHYYKVSLRNWKDRDLIIVITSKDEEGTPIPVFTTRAFLKQECIELEEFICMDFSKLEECIENFESVKKGERKMIIREVTASMTITISKDYIEPVLCFDSPIEFRKI
jgi:hypothetical protein